MPKLTRENVYAAIDGERDYQDAVWRENAGKGPQCAVRTVAEELLLIEEYVSLARKAWTGSPREVENQQTTEVLRKVAGICVRAMENHGAPVRRWPAKLVLARAAMDGANRIDDCAILRHKPAPHRPYNPVLETIFNEITQERAHQDEIWGTEFDNHNTVNDWAAWTNGQMAQATRVGVDARKQRERMLKAAAVLVAAVECYDRNGGFPTIHG